MVLAINADATENLNPIVVGSSESSSLTFAVLRMIDIRVIE